MAATTAIVAGIGSTVYGQVEANQQRQKAKGDAAAILRTQATDSTNKANDASIAAAKSQRAKTQGAGGRASTILTGPQGVTNAPQPQRQTLLGS